jgi:hypothetical protein
VVPTRAVVLEQARVIPDSCPCFGSTPGQLQVVLEVRGSFDEYLLSPAGLHPNALASREFVFTASDGRIYAWKLGALGTNNPTVRASAILICACKRI